MKKALNWLFPLFSVGILVFIYYIASIKADSKIVAPQLDLVVKNLGAVMRRADFAESVFSTLWRAVYGFIISLLIALIFCIGANASKIVERLLSPLIVFSRAIPTMSIILVCLIWLREKTPVAVSVVIVFPMLYSALREAIRLSDAEMKDVIKVYRVPTSKAIIKYYVPDVFIRAFPQLVTTLSFNVKLTVSGEALSHTSVSIGNAMSVANLNFDTATLFAWTIVAVLLAFVVELVLKGIYMGVKKIRYEYRSRKSY